MSEDLKRAIDRAESAARHLGALAEMLDRVETQPAKRALLIPLLVASGEYRDKLNQLERDMVRAGLIDA